MERTKFEQLTDGEISDHVIQLAKKYHSNDFPNPSHEGCPSRDFLRTAFDSTVFNDKGLQRHLLNCSRCFRLIMHRSNFGTHNTGENLNTTEKKKKVKALYPLEKTTISTRELDNAITAAISMRSSQ